MRVFIIDDDPIILALLAFMMEQQGIVCDYTTSCLEEGFYESLKEYQPDVILLDIYLSDNETGMNVANTIRKIPSMKDVPIVAISGSHLLEDKIDAISGGFIDYLEKPFTKEEVLNAVRKYGKFSEIMRLCDKIIDKNEVSNAVYSNTNKEK